MLTVFSFFIIKSGLPDLIWGIRVISFTSSDWSKTLGAHLDNRLITPRTLARPGQRPPSRLSYRHPPLMYVHVFVSRVGGVLLCPCGKRVYPSCAQVIQPFLDLDWNRQPWTCQAASLCVELLPCQPCLPLLPFSNNNSSVDFVSCF